MMSRFVMLLALVPVSSPVVLADEPPRYVLMFEPTKVQCLRFIELERNPIESDGSFNIRVGDMEDIKRYAQERHWFGWLQGFMTAANIYDSRSSGTLGENTDPAGWVSWLVDWCHANPSKKVTEGVYELRRALAGKQ